MFCFQGVSALIPMSSGFINPLVRNLGFGRLFYDISLQIYDPKYSWVFHDITNGTNPGCGESVSTITLDQFLLITALRHRHRGLQGVSIYFIFPSALVRVKDSDYFG
jgi:hypothetical protein